jgi:hypothetical protein
LRRDLYRQAESLIDALLPYFILIGDLWPCAQGQQRSAYPLELNGSENRFSRRPCCLDCQKTLDQFDIRFPASHSFISPDCLQGGSNLRVPDTPTSEGHSAFSDQRMALFRSKFQYAENLLLVLEEQKAPVLRGYWRIVG